MILLLVFEREETKAGLSAEHEGETWELLPILIWVVAPILCFLCLLWLEFGFVGEREGEKGVLTGQIEFRANV